MKLTFSLSLLLVFVFPHLMAQSLPPCYLVGDDSKPDLLVKVDAYTQQAIAIGEGMETSLVESAVFHPSGDYLFGANGQKLGQIDLETGLFEPKKLRFGMANGPAGTILIDNINGLAIDPVGGDLLGVQERKGKADVLVAINQETGQIISHYFGLNQDLSGD